MRVYVKPTPFSEYDQNENSFEIGLPICKKVFWTKVIFDTQPKSENINGPKYNLQNNFVILCLIPDEYISVNHGRT